MRMLSMSTLAVVMAPVIMPRVIVRLTEEDRNREKGEKEES